MATVVIGVDINSSESVDLGFQNGVAKALEDAGHTVEKLPRGPNYYASYSYGNNGKDPQGKIGVYIIAPGLTSICDAYDGNTSFKYNYFAIRGDIGTGIASASDFESKPIHKDRHGDCTSKSCNILEGKTFPQINEYTKSKCKAVYGGKTGEEMGKNILAAMGGGDSSEEGSSTGSTIKDALKQAVSGDGTVGWDGEAEIRIVEDTVYVNRIPDPTTTKIIVSEYENVQYDSVTVTDLNPQTPNKIIMNYEGKTLMLQDKKQIERFEEIVEEVEPDEFVKSYDDAVSFLQRAWNKIRRDDGRQVELKVDGDMKYKTGTWVRAYLPSFFIDEYMYITRASHEEDATGNWSATLTLVDYPPSFGLYQNTSTEEESTDEETTEEDTETTDTDAEATT